MSPKISVVMPVLDGETYLRAAVESILAQSFQDFEFLIIDDGSTDSTPGILKHYSGTDSRIRVLNAGHQGIVKALNLGMSEARGIFLARMDADDIARADRFERQVLELEGKPQIGVLGSYVTCIDEADRPIRVFRGPCEHEALDAVHLTGGPKLWHPSVMMRTELLRHVGGYREGFPYTEDYDLWLRMGEICRLGTLPEPLLSYRLHLGSVSVTKRGLQIDAARKALSEAQKRRGIGNIARERSGNGMPPTEIETIQKWAWWALKSEHIATARHYTLKSLRIAPLSRESRALSVAVMKSTVGRLIQKS